MVVYIHSFLVYAYTKYIRNEGVSMGGFIFITSLFSLGMIVLTILLNLIKMPWIKYIPPGLFLVGAIVMFILSRTGAGTENGGWGDLVLGVMSMLIAITAIVGFVTCLVLDYWRK
jgi:hypothetical protein